MRETSVRTLETRRSVFPPGTEKRRICREAGCGHCSDSVAGIHLVSALQEEPGEEAGCEDLDTLSRSRVSVAAGLPL